MYKIKCSNREAIAKTAKDALEVGTALEREGPVTITLPDGEVFALDQFRKLIVGGVKFGDA